MDDASPHIYTDDNNSLDPLLTVSIIPDASDPLSEGTLHPSLPAHPHAHLHPGPASAMTRSSHLLHGIPTPPTNEDEDGAEVCGGGGGGGEWRGPVAGLKLDPLASAENTVHVIVESDGKRQAFAVHRDLLCYHSRYFSAQFHIDRGSPVKKTLRIKAGMLRREWRWEDEADLAMLDGPSDQELVDVDVTIKLPLAIPQLALDRDRFGDVGRRSVFASFVDWLYLGPAGFGLDQHSARQTGASVLIRLWVFAGRAGCPACQNDCVEAIEMWRQNSGTIQTAELAWIYENTKEYEQARQGRPAGRRRSCGLIELIIDQCAWLLDGEWIAGGEMATEGSFPRAALLDLVGRMRVLINSGVGPARYEPPFLGLEWRKRLYWMPVEGGEPLKF